MKYKAIKTGMTIGYFGLIVFCILISSFLPSVLLGTGLVLSAVLGVRTTANTESTIKVRNVDDIMPYIWSNQFPITQFFLTKDSRQEMTDGDNSKFEHFEKDQRANTTTIAAGLTGGANTETSVTVASAIFRNNDTVIIDETNDICDLYDVSSTTISLRRVGGGNITAATAGCNIRRLAPSFSDNFSRQTAYTTNAEGKTGYCQISLEAIQMTGREQASKKYGNNDSWESIFEETSMNLKFDQDNAFLMNGAAVSETVSDGVRTKSAGLRGSITTNVSEWSGSLDMLEVDDALATIMVRGVKGYTNEWIGWAGTKYIRGLNAALKKERNWEQSDKDKADAIIRVYGGLHKSGQVPNIFVYYAEFGTVYYMWNPNLVDKWSNSCVYTHPQCIKMRYMNSDKNGPRKYRVEENVQDNGGGNRHDQILSDVGLHIKTEKLMGWHNKSE